MPELDKKSHVCPDCLACGFPFWEQLTADEQEFLCRTTRPVRYKKGERVHSPLESCVGILLLRTGQLRAYLLSEDGRDVTLYRLFPGEVCILSASCVLDSVNFDLYIDAEEDTEAYCIGAGTFRRLMQQNIHVRCFAYQMTAERLLFLGRKCFYRPKNQQTPRRYCGEKWRCNNSGSFQKRNLCK